MSYDYHCVSMLVIYPVSPQSIHLYTLTLPNVSLNFSNLELLLRAGVMGKSCFPGLCLLRPRCLVATTMAFMRADIVLQDILPASLDVKGCPGLLGNLR